MTDDHSGTQWVIRGDGRVRPAANTTEACAAILGGEYAELGPDEAFERRWEASCDAAAYAQGALRDAAAARGWSPDEEDPEVRAALFTDSLGPVEVDTWSHEIPLVLIATDYAPTTDLPRPTGNVVWIDPSDETSWLRSLDAAGLLSADPPAEH